MGRHMRALGWTSEPELLSAGPISGGNMNAVVRVHLEGRSVILKQARPWVEKYPQIGAPVERAEVEAAFYRAVSGTPAVADRMPRLLGSDPENHLLLLEDLPDATDLTTIYSGAHLTSAEFGLLIDYLNALHEVDVDPALRPLFENRTMRELNHAHQYEIPLSDEREEVAGAKSLKRDPAYRKRAAELGRLYLSSGPALLHGDYFPGSWLRTPRGIFVIDPEFCFLGLPEFDLGIFQAHLVLSAQHDLWANAAGLYRRRLDWQLVDAFAGIEMMRRLIGVAQLPLTAGPDQLSEWLELSRKLVCA